MPEIGTHLWTVHDHPHRPLRFGAEFCPCAACRRRLEEAGEATPDLPIGVKFGLSDRLVIEAGLLAGDGVSAQDLVRRFGSDDDWVREVWVARSIDDAMSAGEAAILAALRDAGLPEPAWNVSVDADGTCRPAGVRRLRKPAG